MTTAVLNRGSTVPRNLMVPLAPARSSAVGQWKY